MLFHSTAFQNPGYDLQGLQVLVDKDLQALTPTFGAVACGSQALQVFVNKDLQAHLRLCRMRLRVTVVRRDGGRKVCKCL